MAIEIEKSDTKLVIKFDTTYDYLLGEFQKEPEREVRLKHTFFLSKENLLPTPNQLQILNQENTSVLQTMQTSLLAIQAQQIEESIDSEEVSFNGLDELTFLLGKIDEHGYYQIKKNILGLKYDLAIWKDVAISSRTFVATRNISIFRKIEKLTDEPIIIGGEAVNAVTEEDFILLQKQFPTTTELDRYADTRIAQVLGEYFPKLGDTEEKLVKHLEKRARHLKLENQSVVDYRPIQEYDSTKYSLILEQLERMLSQEESIRESVWQNYIADIILLIYPKYLCVIKELPVLDGYSDKNRKIDLAMLDADGNIDIIEIKKPSHHSLLARGKLRDNFFPARELAGTIMQAEKYLHALNRGGKKYEELINVKKKNQLPEGLEIKVTNPKALLILGRDSEFSQEQRRDFEIIKRKYANVMDIINYDDLIRRLKRIIHKNKITTNSDAVQGA